MNILETPPSECLTSYRGADYFGTSTRTQGGLTCMRWDSQSPHSHGNGYLKDQENYCRNPFGSEPKGPWCYTIDPNKRWDYCSIPMCGKTLILFRQQFSWSGVIFINVPSYFYINFSYIGKEYNTIFSFRWKRIGRGTIALAYLYSRRTLDN